MRQVNAAYAALRKFYVNQRIASPALPKQLPPSVLKQVTIHTDGACRGNPGPGGFGAVLVSGKHRLELSAGFLRSTNNRMELLAAIAALEKLNTPCKVTLISDSRYVVDAMTKGWLHGWKKKGWRTSNNQPVKNIDLWRRLEAASAPHEITWKWIKGHTGHRENERCDELAVAASQGDDLEVDTGFENAGEPDLF